MAFEADWGSSTVLKAFRAASITRFPVPEVTFRGPRDEALRDSATPTGAFRQRIEAAGRQIRNPKSEIRNFMWVAGGGIPNSEFRIQYIRYH